jgi:hypothetical protein
MDTVIQYVYKTTLIWLRDYHYTSFDISDIKLSSKNIFEQKVTVS